METRNILYGEGNIYEYCPDSAKLDNSCYHELYSDTHNEYVIKLLPEANEEMKEKIRWLARFRCKWEQRPKYAHYVSAFPLEEVFFGSEHLPTQWAGYVMKKCDDVHFNAISSFPEAFEKKFENSYATLLCICWQLCLCVAFLQRHSIRLSDIKPNNFFVRSDCRVYPIDTDGFSVRLKKDDGSSVWTCSEMPLPIYHPEGKLPNASESGYKQTWKTECYAISMLLLQVLTNRDFTHERTLKKLRKYKLALNPEEAHHLETADVNDFEMMFYKFWYVMPQDFRDIFLNLIYGNCAYRLPTAMGWANKLEDYLRYLVSAEKYFSIPPETLEPTSYCTTWTPEKVPAVWNQWTPIRTASKKRKHQS